MSDKQTAGQKLNDLYKLAMTELRPEPVVFYKPNQSGTGVAAKFNLRLSPVYDEVEGFLKETNGGLFVDIVSQGEKNQGGFPTFKWTDRESLVTAKFGLPDVSGLLAAIRDFRYRGIEVPTYLLGKDKKPNVVNLFHKTETTGTTGISYTFQPESSVLRLSKSKDLHKSISLTLGEEVILEAYLRLSLTAFLKVGMR